MPFPHLEAPLTSHLGAESGLQMASHDQLASKIELYRHLRLLQPQSQAPAVAVDVVADEDSFAPS